MKKKIAILILGIWTLGSILLVCECQEQDNTVVDIEKNALAGINQVLLIDLESVEFDEDDNGIEVVAEEENLIGYATTKVNIRSTANIESDIVCTVDVNTCFQYFICNDEWYSIILEDGTEGYIYIDYVSDEPVEVPVVSQSDIELLATLIYSESGSLGYTAMQYSGSVVINRMNDSRFPDTLSGVIYQSGQYACTWDGNWKTPSEEALEIAEDLLLYGSVLPSNVVWQAGFVQGTGIYTTIGNTYYCY